MAYRKIIHIDMDCFYAAIEIRENPTLADKPVAVGGTPQQRGVLATCNYIARKYGLHSAMSTAQALKRCPHLVLLPVNMSFYKQVSQQIHQIFQRYTDIIEPLSLDEAYLDVTDSTQCSGSATWIAEAIRRDIWQELHLTASAGVAPLKFLAKVASEQNKPNGQFVIPPEKVAEFVHDLPLRKIPGVGKVVMTKLAAMGLETCGDVQRFPRHTLNDQLGKMGERIWQFSHANDERQVQPHRATKSVGVEETLLTDLASPIESELIMQKLYQQLLKRLQKYALNFATQTFKLGIKLKFTDFQQTTVEKTGLLCDLAHYQQLLEIAWQRSRGRKVRLIGLHLYLPEKSAYQQMSLWE
ncbi:DNA polymerase IV [Gallibacterium salpingitidis]|uniref:DNA polymerase IV n=1 Tax=Gallibacterium salpingitidis TaxID=505341 RepID=A0AB36E2D3_9PAST|nr:DNA polymerase IV [Gallibacterium salpingitidis]OBX08815.1 DNA polymerase IV [Gallibacterium salpingitidis]OBX10278.1 DNA polymerase IV [Gallibacterium salpingitidis]